METAQKIQQLEAEKQQLIQQSIITENSLQGLRQQVALIEGRLIELKEFGKTFEPKKNGTKEKPKTSKAD